MLENTVWFSLFSASLNRMLSSQSLPFFPNADRALYFLYLSLTRSGVLQATFLPCPYHSILHPSYQYGETILILFTIHFTFSDENNSFKNKIKTWPESFHQHSWPEGEIQSCDWDEGLGRGGGDEHLGQGLHTRANLLHGEVSCHQEREEDASEGLQREILST